MIVVDASVWIGVAIGDDTFHPRSFAWLATSLAGGEQYAVPTIVFPEVAGAVARRSRSVAEGDRARQLVASTSGLHVVVVDADLADLAARLAADLGLRGADAVYVALSARHTCPLVTWDAEIIRKAAGVIEARQPE